MMTTTKLDAIEKKALSLRDAKYPSCAFWQTLGGQQDLISNQDMLTMVSALRAAASVLIEARMREEGACYATYFEFMHAWAELQ